MPFLRASALMALIEGFSRIRSRIGSVTTSSSKIPVRPR